MKFIQSTEHRAQIAGGLPTTKDLAIKKSKPSIGLT